MMRRFLLAAALLAATVGHAQTPPGQGGMVPGTNRPVPPFGSMAPNTGGMTTNPVTGTPATPCNAGQLDFSDATGCNLMLYMVGLR